MEVSVVRREVRRCRGVGRGVIVSWFDVVGM